MTPDTLKLFFDRLKKQNPDPHCELDFTNDFTLLVAIVLSAQTTDKKVNAATPDLFKVADTPEKMLALGEEKLKTFIRSIGLFNTKAKNVIALSKKLIDDFGGKVPADRDTLRSLPGVGRKTANVFLNEFYRQPTFGVDTHVFRLCNRLGIAPGKTPEQVEKNLEKAVTGVLSADDLTHVSHWLVLHGRYVCKAQKPLCDICPNADICPAKKR